MWEIEGKREVDRERERSGQRGVDLEAMTTIFGGDDEIGHGWVNLEGSDDEIKRGGKDELRVAVTRTRWQGSNLDGGDDKFQMVIISQRRQWDCPKFKLSLSLWVCELENDLKVNEKHKPFYGSKGLFYSQILLFSV